MICTSEKILGPPKALRSKRNTVKIICSAKPNVWLPLPESCYGTLILCQCGKYVGHRFSIDMYESIQGVPGGKDLTSGECSLG